MLRLAPLLLAALVLAALRRRRGRGDRRTESAASGGVRELSNVLELRAAFEADSGKTRLLVLFSPT